MKTEEIALSRVSENEENPRTITETNFQKLVKSILVFPKMLQLRPIVVDETYKALGGNMRTRALCHIVSMTPEAIMDVLDTDQRLTDAEKMAIANYWSQWKEQPTATIVKASDLTEAQKKEFIIKDNAGFGDWDTDALANQWNTDLLKDWGIQDWQLQGWMSPDSLKNGEQADDDQKEAKDDEFDEDTEKIPQRCKEFELWQLGKHRLMCGDSTKAECVEALLQGERADLCFTDPPYGIDYSGGRTQVVHNKEYGKLKNDDLQGADLGNLICQVFNYNKEGADVYICVSPIMQKPFLDIIEQKGKKVNAVIVWDKKQPGLGYMAYRRQCEFILFVKGGPFHKGDKSDVDIWSIARDNGETYVHGTQKPVGVSGRAITNSSKEGDIVLDYFGGSGSTLIACEQLGRKARLMELDPHYCDVIIARWEKLTGEKAVKIDEFKKQVE